MPKVRFLIALISLIFISMNSYSYEGLLFKPLTANPFEGRIGAISEISDEKLRLDIGTSLDLTDFKYTDGSEIRIGADVFTLSRLRVEERMKFPVETIDYYFGFNTSGKTNINNLLLSSRLRLAHISSHLEDGYANGSIFKQAPFVYSREFAEIVFAIDSLNSFIGLSNSNLRFYAGLKFVFSTSPGNLQKFIPQVGFDFSKQLSKNIDFVLGYDLTINNDTFNNTSLCNSFQSGINIQTSNKVGFFIGYYYYSGKSLHGQFNEIYDEYHGIGFQITYY